MPVRFFWKKTPQEEFNAASMMAASGDFFIYLQKKFDSVTASKVLGVFEKLGLPPPSRRKEFANGSHGGIVFLNDCGVVIRVEVTDMRHAKLNPDRVSSSARVLRPLGSVSAGLATVEICPGYDYEDSEENSDALIRDLRSEGIDFFDSGAHNVGRLPVKLPQFPNGVPCVIDRGAVRKLSRLTYPVRRALLFLVDHLPGANTSRHVVAQAEKELYDPLRKTFKSAWPNPEKMKLFWNLCRRYTAEGKLIAGWNKGDGSDIRTSCAADFSRNYQETLRVAGFIASDMAGAVRPGAPTA